MTSPSYPASAAPSDPINLNEEASLHYWVTALECSELELRMAVAQVGPAAQDVSTELGRVL